MTKTESKPTIEPRTAGRASRNARACRQSSFSFRPSFSFRHYLALLALAFLFTPVTVDAAEKVTYETHVKPILREHCFACHNQDDATASLALDSFDGAITGGAGGGVVSAGDPDGSRLWKLITHQEEPKMPPGDKLPQANLDVIKAWITGGLLKDVGSKPLERKKSAIAKIDADKLGKPVGKPAMPEQLFHEPVLWTLKPGPVEALATSPWAPVAAIGWQRQVSFYHTDTHQLLGIIPYVEGVPKVVRFSRDGSLVLVAGGRHAAAGSAALFDVKTGNRLATVGDELDIVLAADISADLSLVAIGGPKKRVKVYRVADGELQYQVTKHTEWITALGFSPDGKLLATADRNGGALVWQATAGHERADLRGHKGTITALDWRADSAMLATASEDGTVKLWDPAGNQIKSVTTNKGGVLSVRFAQDGNFVTAGRDRHVRTWKPDGGSIADLGKMRGLTLAAAFTHDGKHVLASDFSGVVRVIDAPTKKTIATLSPNPQRLAHRMAEAEKALQSKRKKVDAGEKRAQARLAALDQAKAAHEAHNSKLAASETDLAEKRKLYDEAVEFLHSTNEQTEQRLATQQAAAQAVSKAEEELKAALELQANVANETTEQPESTDAAESSGDSESDERSIADLRKKVDLAKANWKSAQQTADELVEKRSRAVEKEQTSLKTLQAAEELLAKLTDETAGLPDLAKLTDQHDQAKAQLDAVQSQLKQAEQLKTTIAAQQLHFANAKDQLANRLEARQSEQQELAKQTGRLEAEHRQAADHLSAHSRQLAEVAGQLERLQGQLAELQAAESELRESENSLAKQLSDVQTTLEDSQQQAGLLQQLQQDFESAEALRKKYSAD